MIGRSAQASFSSERLQWHGLFFLALLPLGWIAWRILIGDLGTDPAQTLVDTLGASAMWLLLATLSLTPLREWAGWRSAIRFRRLLGLFCAFYASLHVLAYGFLLADWFDFAEDLAKRPYILLGFLAFCIVLALAATSPKAMVRRLGKRWKPLHRLIYPAAILVVLHFWWQTRTDFGEPLLLALLFALVLGLRLPLVRRFQPG